MPTRKPQASATARGYGSAHQKLRARLIADLALNPGQPCCRCGRPMYAEQELQLDHDDMDRSRYRGLAHKHCNLRAGAIKGNRKRGRRRQWIKAQTASRW